MRDYFTDYRKIKLGTRYLTVCEEGLIDTPDYRIPRRHVKYILDNIGGRQQFVGPWPVICHASGPGDGLTIRVGCMEFREFLLGEIREWAGAGR